MAQTSLCLLLIISTLYPGIAALCAPRSSPYDALLSKYLPPPEPAHASTYTAVSPSPLTASSSRSSSPPQSAKTPSFAAASSPSSSPTPKSAPSPLQYASKPLSSSSSSTPKSAPSPQSAKPPSSSSSSPTKSPSSYSPPLKPTQSPQSTERPPPSASSPPTKSAAKPPTPSYSPLSSPAPKSTASVPPPALTPSFSPRSNKDSDDKDSDDNSSGDEDRPETPAKVLDDSLKAICDKLPDPGLCMTALPAASKDDIRSIDLLGALKLAIKGIITEARDARNKARSSSTNGDYYDSVNICNRTMGSALRQAKEALTSVQYGSFIISSTMDVISHSIGVCEERDPPPLIADMARLRKLLTNAYYILWKLEPRNIPAHLIGKV